MMRKCVWIGVALFAIICGVEGIKCWACRSDINPRCADPFDNTSIPLVDCDSVGAWYGHQESMCRKTSQKVNGNWVYIRSCTFPRSLGEGTGNETHCTIIETRSVFIETCTCNSEDGCNSGIMNLNEYNV